ncbi:hypothetical protein GCM10010218_49040 [Streptomyces mashuensis]|uniref:Uncharacterized protein n=1 Tax=Streptomyces mashuensis TaxID=33904 RepID=A0A919B7A3_9ACTN|nr:hypothetical protein [Streptomyces mashuensis]GHF61690.1 hypothetical protein GCM10010218_49040 [Streptomyces mashuensis]
MSPTQIDTAETAAMPRTVLADLVAAVKEDSPTVVAGVKKSVDRSQQDANNCMMGGWTS